MEEAATSIGGSPPWALVLGTLIGLPATLWLYKCFMMVIFQRSIIYMGAWPPGARTTPVDAAHPALRQLEVKDVSIVGSDPGVTLRGVELWRPPSPISRKTDERPTVILYFQGNMGSPVARIPLFAHLLTSTSSPFSAANTTLYAIAPRSYYLSTNSKATQGGLTRDYRDILLHVQRAHPASRLIMYAHSLGGTAACCLLGSALPEDSDLRPPAALILENPFPSIPAMIERSLYPSMILPYHWLSPFVLDTWDALSALSQPGTLLSRTPVLFVSGAGDSLVKPELVREMYDAATAGEDSGCARRRWLSIADASHDDTWARKGPWGRGVRAFLDEEGRERSP